MSAFCQKYIAISISAQRQIAKTVCANRWQYSGVIVSMLWECSIYGCWDTDALIHKWMTIYDLQFTVKSLHFMIVVIGKEELCRIQMHIYIIKVFLN